MFLNKFIEKMQNWHISPRILSLLDKKNGKLCHLFFVDIVDVVVIGQLIVFRLNIIRNISIVLVY